MNGVIVLSEKNFDYIEKDYVANKIKNLFENPHNFVIKIYSNEEWSFYEYNCLSSMLEKPVLSMGGSCLVKNSTKECCEIVHKEKDGSYFACLSTDETIYFKLESLPNEKRVLPRFT